jgi:17 kDa common-antigen outer membrane protein
MRVRSGAGPFPSNPRFVLGLLALTAPGCSSRYADGGTTQPVSSAAVAVVDPVAAFAAAATPGSETIAVLPETGGNARLRLLRSYNAASGRECREVLIGTGLAERSRLLCRQEGGWAAARPLLSGGGARP